MSAAPEEEGGAKDRRERRILLAIGVALVLALVVPWAWDRLVPDGAVRDLGKEKVEVARVLPQPPPAGEGRYKPNRPNKKPNTGGQRVHSDLPAGAVEAAKRYIDARENEASYMHTDPGGWVSATKPLMTADGWNQKFGDFRVPRGASGGAAWRLAQQKKIRVDTEVECTHYAELGPPTAKAVGLTCTVIDKPVYANGQPVPLADLTPAWVYIGPRPTYRLAMTNQGGWKVGADATGIA